MFDHNSKKDPRNGLHSETEGQKNCLQIQNRSAYLPSMLIPKRMTICQDMWPKSSYEIPTGCQNEDLITRSISFYFLLVDEVNYKGSYCKELAGLK